jgi:N-acetylmuramoyl-L-alanine amidase
MSRKPFCVVIDPGHGGESKGAVGLSGLEEREVNLSVALNLMENLEAAGMRVILTREDDVDVSHRDRAGMAIREGADVFVSIHHNANAQMDRTINRSEIYVPFDLGSPAFDLAYLLRMELQAKLKLPCEPPLPALYNVLKGNVPVSLLGEASYISCPEEERRLRRAPRRKKEAAAYLEAIRAYLSRGIPRVDSFERKGSVLLSTLSDRGGEGPDPDTIEMTLDGRPVRPDFNPKTGALRCRIDPDLGNGRHESLLWFRNKGGNRSPTSRLRFRIDRSVCSFALSTHPRKGRMPFILSANLFDEWGLPCADREDVTVDVPGGRVLAQSQRTDREGRVRAILEFGRSENEVILRAGNFEGVVRLELGRINRKSYIYGRTTNRLDGSPVTGATLHVPGRSARSQFDGWYVLEFPEGERVELAVTKQGFSPETVEIGGESSGRMDLELTPVYKGVLLTRRIVLDPLWAEDPEIDRSNLGVARELRRFLSDGGARVWMTRDTNLSRSSKVDRVKLALDCDSEIFLSIGHFSTRKPELRTYRYYLDRRGEELCRALCDAVSDSLPMRAGSPLESSAYEMIQPRGARATVFLGLETAPLSSDAERDEARALFLGVLGYSRGKDVRG